MTKIKNIKTTGGATVNIIDAKEYIHYCTLPPRNQHLADSLAQCVGCGRWYYKGEWPNDYWRDVKWYHFRYRSVINRALDSTHGDAV